MFTRGCHATMNYSAMLIRVVKRKLKSNQEAKQVCGNVLTQDYVIFTFTDLCQILGLHILLWPDYSKYNKDKLPYKGSIPENK